MEGKGRAVTKADVAAAKAVLLEKKIFPSTPKVREELAKTIRHSGNQNQVAQWLKELRDEEKVLVKNDQFPPPAEPLPHEVQEVLDKGQATIACVFTTLAGALATALTSMKTEIRKSADQQIAAAIADAERKVGEAEIEAVDRGADIERLDQEVERLQNLLELKDEEIPQLREALAAARERATTFEVERNAADRERVEAQLRVEQATGELATLRERAAVLTKERDHALRQLTELQAHLEKATEAKAATLAELGDLKVIRAELTGENRQLVSERDNYRERARQERERAEQALEEAQVAKAQLEKLTMEKAAAGKKPLTNAAPTA